MAARSKRSKTINVKSSSPKGNGRYALRSQLVKNISKPKVDVLVRQKLNTPHDKNSWEELSILSEEVFNDIDATVNSPASNRINKLHKKGKKKASLLNFNQSLSQKNGNPLKRANWTAVNKSSSSSGSESLNEKPGDESNCDSQESLDECKSLNHFNNKATNQLRKQQLKENCPGETKIDDAVFHSQFESEMDFTNLQLSTNTTKATINSPCKNIPLSQNSAASKENVAHYLGNGTDENKSMELCDKTGKDCYSSKLEDQNLFCISKIGTGDNVEFGQQLGSSMNFQCGRKNSTLEKNQWICSDHSNSSPNKCNSEISVSHSSVCSSPKNLSPAALSEEVCGETKETGDIVLRNGAMSPPISMQSSLHESSSDIEKDPQLLASSNVKATRKKTVSPKKLHANEISPVGIERKKSANFSGELPKQVDESDSDSEQGKSFEKSKSYSFSPRSGSNMRANSPLASGSDRKCEDRLSENMSSFKENTPSPCSSSSGKTNSEEKGLPLKNSTRENSDESRLSSSLTSVNEEASVENRPSSNDNDSENSNAGSLSENFSLNRTTNLKENSPSSCPNDDSGELKESNSNFNSQRSCAASNDIINDSRDVSESESNCSLYKSEHFESSLSSTSGIYSENLKDSPIKKSSLKRKKYLAKKNNIEAIIRSLADSDEAGKSSEAHSESLTSKTPKNNLFKGNAENFETETPQKCSKIDVGIMGLEGSVSGVSGSPCVTNRNSGPSDLDTDRSTLDCTLSQGDDIGEKPGCSNLKKSPEKCDTTSKYNFRKRPGSSSNNSCSPEVSPKGSKLKRKETSPSNNSKKQKCKTITAKTGCGHSEGNGESQIKNRLGKSLNSSNTSSIRVKRARNSEDDFSRDTESSVEKSGKSVSSDMASDSSDDEDKDNSDLIVNVDEQEVNITEIVNRAFKKWRLPFKVLKKVQAIDTELVWNKERLFKKLENPNRSKVMFKRLLNEDELKMMYRRWSEFCKLYSFNRKKPRYFFSTPIANQYFSSNFIKYFCAYISRDLTHSHTNKMILRNFQNMFEDNFHENVTYTDYEDAVILALHENLKDTVMYVNNLAAFTLNRSYVSITKRHLKLRQNSNKKTKKRNTNTLRPAKRKERKKDQDSLSPVDSSEEEHSFDDLSSTDTAKTPKNRPNYMRLKSEKLITLLDNVLTVSGCTGTTIQQVADKDLSAKDWQLISSKIGDIPPYAAKALFETKIHPLLTQTQIINKYKLISDILQHLKSRNYTSWDDVKWSELSESAYRLKPLFLFTTFIKFVQSQVPLEHQETYADCMDYLFTRTMDLIEQKINDVIVLDVISVNHRNEKC